MKTTNPLDAARIELLLSELRLPAIKLMWAKFAEQADKEGWPAARFLAALAEHEIADRARRELFLVRVRLGNRDALQPRERRTITVASESVDLALLKFLEELIFYKDARRLLLHADSVRIVGEQGTFRLEAEVSGEEIDRSRHRLLVDVKAVTLHSFQVVYEDHCWKAVVVLDV